MCLDAGCPLAKNKKNQLKNVINQLKNILIKFHDIIFGSNSTPLIDTLSAGLICNQFCNNSNQKIFAIYNFTKKKISGPFFRLETKNKIKIQQIFGTKKAQYILKHSKKIKLYTGLLMQMM